MTATTQPTDDEIMEVVGLTSASTEQFCDRLRALFAGVNQVVSEGPKSLEDYQAEIREINTANGWWDDGPRPFGDDVALMHTEVSEVYEAYREHGFEDATVDRKPEGVGSELADVVIRVLDTCERHGVLLRYEIERKLAYNRTRSYRHGGKRI